MDPPRNVSHLESLPLELTNHILELLDSSSPISDYDTKRPPTVPRRFMPQSLKNLSLVSRAWRTLVVPILFRHCRLQLKVLRPFVRGMVISQLRDFMSFVGSKVKARFIKSLCIFISHRKITIKLARKFCGQLISELSTIPCGQISISASPQILSVMTGVKLCHVYTSAYKMDRQFLRLSRTSRPSQIAPPESLFDFGNEPASYWQHMSLNEGSFISPYEDFRYLAAGDFRPPSMVKGLLEGPSPGASRLMENLTSLHYRAVSPAEPHAQDLVELVARCPALETLTVQLGDLLGCLWLDNEDDKSRDQILGYAVDDILDCYYTVIPAVASLGGKGKLRRFVSYDCGSEIDDLDGLEDEIDGLLYPNRWGIIARGEWEKLEERATSPGWSDPDDYEDGGYDEYDEHYEEGHEEW